MCDYINHCAVDELLEYSLNVQELEERAARICKLIADNRGIDKVMTPQKEHRLWRVEGRRIHTAYLNYCQFGRQKCVTDHLNEATFEKLGSELALTHEDTIASLIAERDKEVQVNV